MISKTKKYFSFFGILIATVSRKNELHIVDSTTNKLYKTCKLQGDYMSGGMVISPKGDTAYVLQDNWGAVYGYDLNSCENTFIAKFSQESNVREMSIFSFTLSPDGKKLYTISNPTQMLNDRYKVMDLDFSLKKRIRPFITSFNSEKSAETAIAFKASFPAFFPTSFGPSIRISLPIAFPASLSASSIRASSAASLSFNLLLFFSFCNFFSRSDLFDSSTF